MIQGSGFVDLPSPPYIGVGCHSQTPDDGSWRSADLILWITSVKCMQWFKGVFREHKVADTEYNQDRACPSSPIP